MGFHNTMSLGYVRNSLSSQFLFPGMTACKSEHGVELNVLMLFGPVLVQPVIQCYANMSVAEGALSLPDSGRRWNFNEKRLGEGSRARV